ncbi:MAG: glycosyl hydrolase [Candidatus Heimdallarchaeota archaeon]|nr:glycosyl hydrolase [Candidatus Heimdallarchaeota archaeon]
MPKGFSKKWLNKYPYFNSKLPLDKRIELLLAKLTLKDKFRLLSGRRFSFWTTKPIRRLKLKPLGMTDGPNGVAFHSSFRRNTQFPASKCLSATWNRSLANEYGIAVAQEVRAAGRHVLLAPGINIDRTPLNGRTFEYFSEDPYLTQEIATPFVKGVQSQRIAACIKHYVANNQETDRFLISAEVDERTLEEIYLRAFKEVTREANPWLVMACYNKVNGIYGCEHKKLLKEKLIEEWGFTGFVVSDWWASKYLSNPENCVQAGLSLEMPKPFAYKRRLLTRAFKEGKIAEEELDFVVRRLLRVMFLVGLFDPDDKIPEGKRNTQEHQNIARKIAQEGIVLLKNDNNLLPLSINRIEKIAVIGPNANKRMGRLLYGGSSAVIPPYEITPLRGLKEKIQGKIKLSNDPAAADVCIVFAGLNHDKGHDAENRDRTKLELPTEQIQLINQTIKQNPRTIIVLINGSPIAMNQWSDNVPAIIEAWYPGMEGGRAIADILFGDSNPSGKLPLTFPKSLSDSPAHQSPPRSYPGENGKVYYEESIFVGYRYFDRENIEPLFPFGFGLSYTDFDFENLKIDKEKMAEDQSIEVSVDITNIGERAGGEVIQLYIQDDASTIERPLKELRGFEKIFLEPNESKIVKFNILNNDLAFYDVNKQSWVTEEGTFTVLVGNSSRDTPSKTRFRLVK